MAPSQRLSGEEVEQWFRDFARNTNILDARQHSLEPLVRLFDQKLQWRLTQASLNAYAKFPEGPEWISKIQQGRTLPLISEQTKQTFSEYLLDCVLAVDVPLTLQDLKGNDIEIAVDVTSDHKETQGKLRKIRGQIESEKGQNINNNRRIPEVRSELGYKRHIVVVLNNEVDQLPSYDKLLGELQAFATTPSRTGFINLQKVPEQERFINQKPPETPRQIWGRYNQELNLTDPAKRITEIVARTYQEGLGREPAIKVLLEDPFFRRMKSGPTQARRLATQMVERIWSEQEQAQSIFQSEQATQAQNREPQPKPEDWPIYASAIGRGRVIQARVKKVVTAYQQGKSLKVNDRISLNKAFKAFNKELASIQDWREAAQQLGEEPDYLQMISETEDNLRQGHPLSDDERLVMNWDRNQLAYNQLSAGLDHEDPRASLVRLAANAFKKGILRLGIKEILSFSPVVRAIKEEKGEQACLRYTTNVMRDGWKLKKQEQPKRPPPGQQRGPDIDRGPSR